MVFYYIVAMGEDKAKLEARVFDAKHPDRIRNTNRLSHTLTKRRLRDMKPVAEIEAAKATKKSAVRKVIQLARHANEARTLKIFSKQDKVVASGSKLVRGGEKAEKALQKVDNEEVVEKVFKKEEEEELEEVDEEEEEEVLEELNEPSGEVKKSDVLEKEQVLPSGSKSLNEPPAQSLERLKADLASFLREEVEKLRSGPAAAAAANNDILQVPMPNDAEVPKGKIHIGDGVLVDLKEVHEKVELTSFELWKRIRQLVMLFYPDDFVQRSLDPEKVLKNANAQPCLPITKTHVAIMCDLLQKMGWPKGSTIEFSLKNVSSLIRKETMRFREAARLAAVPEHERKLHIEGLKQKAKDLRAAAQKRKAETAGKNKKQKRNSISDSDED